MFIYNIYLLKLYLVISEEKFRPELLPEIA